LTPTLMATTQQASRVGLPVVLLCFCRSCKGSSEATLLMRAASFAAQARCSCGECREPVVIAAHEDRAWACETLKALAVEWE
jgi:hypothetical protein